jgi:hypothetical protein
MKPVTLRNVPPDVERAIRRRAREKGSSLNKAIITLLEERVGVRRRTGQGVVYHDLDNLAGTWSQKEAAEFDTALGEQRRIDEELWE